LESLLSNTFIQEGPGALSVLRPLHLLIRLFRAYPACLFLEYTVKHDELSAISVSFKGNYRERNYAEMFVDIDKHY
jgi:hypothetical protein